MTDRTNPRAIAHDLLIKAERSEQYSNIALDKALEASSLSEPDKRLASALFYGVIEKRISLDYRLRDLSSRPVCEIDLPTLCALRLGLYQLIYMDKIPPHAAINETVSLCQKKSTGFVNGILRTHTRKAPSELPDKSISVTEHLSVAYSVCEPLCKRLVEIYGADKAESILSAFGAPPMTTLRANTLVMSADELSERIDGAQRTELSPHGIKIRGSVREKCGFDDGAFFVQDEASQICVEALDAQEGMTVMDICACPGSKSFGAAINMNNKGRVLSFDLHERKLSLITNSASRLGIDIITARAQDGKQFIPEYAECADRVLCDVPCSGFGVLAKKPELRYKDPSTSAGLPAVQLAILENACRYVKKDGVLVYSTCTILPEENEENVRAFLDSHAEFELEPFSVGKFRCETGYITLLPDEYPTDGFFIAKLKRKK